jgi:hypothetical protein
MGIDPMDPARGKALDQVEKRDLAGRLSKSTGAAYTDPGRMSGVLSDAGTLASGKRYAQIFDAKSREFTLVPWRPEFDRLAGKGVALLKDQQAGRYMVRQLERGIGR